MQIIKFERNEFEDDLFNKLRGKSFFAVSVTKNGDEDYTYTWHTKELSQECILMGLELLKKALMDDLVGQHNESED